MRTCVHSILLLSTVAACSQSAQVDVASLDAQTDVSGLVPYGREFWRRSGDERPAGQPDIGEVVERVGNAFREAGRGKSALKNRRYAITVDSSGVSFGDALNEPMTFSTHAHAADDDLALKGSRQWTVVGNTAQRQLVSDLDAVEHIEARSDYVELTWAINSPPLSRSDVVFDFDIFSAHTPTLDSGGAIWTDASGHARYRVGPATAIDSSGHKTELHAQLVAGRVAYTLPQSFIDGATFPLAVDPIILPAFDVELPSLVDQHGNGVAATLASGQSLVVWRDEDSVGGNIYGARVSAAGALVDVAPVMIHDGWKWPSNVGVQVAAVGDTYVVAWQTAFIPALQVKRVAATGAVLDATPLRVADGCGLALPFSVACTPERCAAVCNAEAATGYELRGAFFAPGVSAEAPIVLASGSSSFDTTIAANDDRFAAAWSSGPTTSSTLTLSFFSDDLPLTPSSQNYTATTGGYARPDITWYGGTFAAVALNDRSNQAAPNNQTLPIFGLFSATGAQTLAFKQLTTLEGAKDVAIVGSPSAWVISHVDEANDVYAMAVNSSGSTTASPILLSTESALTASVELTGLANTSKVLATWSMTADWNDGLYHAFQTNVRTRLVDVANAASVTTTSSVLDPSKYSGDLSWFAIAENAGIYAFAWIQPDGNTAALRGALVTSAGEILTPAGLSLQQGTNLTLFASVVATYNGFIFAAIDADVPNGTVPFSQFVSTTGTVSPAIYLAPNRVMGDEALRITEHGGSVIAAWNNNLTSGTPFPLSHAIVRLDSHGAPIGPVQRINAAGSLSGHSIAMLPNRAVLAYAEADTTSPWPASAYNLRYRILTPDGAGFSVGPPQLLTSHVYDFLPSAQNVEVATSSSGFTFAWKASVGSTAVVESARLDAQGVLIPMAAPLATQSSGPLLGPVIAENSDEHAVVWGYGFYDSIHDPYPASARFLNAAGVPSDLLPLSGIAFQNVIALARGRRPAEFLLAYATTTSASAHAGQKITSAYVMFNGSASDADSDAHTIAQGDCDDANPNVWTSCTTCRDNDGDGYWAGCDAYTTIAGPDCDDMQSQTTCAPASSVFISIQSPTPKTYQRNVSAIVSIANATASELTSTSITLDGVDITPDFTRNGTTFAGTLNGGDGGHTFVVTVQLQSGGSMSASRSFVINAPSIVIPASQIVQFGKSGDTLTTTDSNDLFGLGSTDPTTDKARPGDLPYSFIHDKQSIQADGTLALIATSQDIDFKGRAGLDFVLGRTYSSDDAINKRAQGRVDLVAGRIYDYIAQNGVYLPNNLDDLDALQGDIRRAHITYCNLLSFGAQTACLAQVVAYDALYDGTEASLHQYAERVRDFDFQYPGIDGFLLCRSEDGYQCWTLYNEISCSEAAAHTYDQYISGDICGPGAKIRAELTIQILDVRRQYAAAVISTYANMATQAGWSRHYEIRSGLGQGWSLNLPFIEFPSQNYDRSGKVWFDGRRPKEFFDLEAAVFNHESALLWTLSGAPPTTGTVPCPGQAVSRECLAYELGANNPIIGSAKPRIPADGNIRDDLEYRLVVRDKFYYFDAWGRPRIVTDVSHNNVIEIVWTANAASNEDALSNSRIDFIIDSVGNRFDFDYLSASEIQGLRTTFANRYGVQSSDPGAVYIDQAPPSDPPLIKMVSGPDVRILYRYEILPQYRPFTDDIYVPESGAETWVLSGVEVYGAPTRGAGGLSRMAAYEYGYHNLRYFNCEGHTADSSGRYICGRQQTSGPNPVVVPIAEYVPLLTVQRGPSLENVVVGFNSAESFEGQRNQGIPVQGVANVSPEAFRDDAGFYQVASRPMVSWIEEGESSNRQSNALWSNLSSPRFEEFTTNMPHKGSIPPDVYIKRETGGYDGNYRHFNIKHLKKLNGTWQIDTEEDRWGESEATSAQVRLRKYTYDDLDRPVTIAERETSVLVTNIYDDADTALLRSYDNPSQVFVALQRQPHTRVDTTYRADYPWLLKQRVTEADLTTTETYDFADESSRANCLTSADPGFSLRPVAAVFDGPERHEVTCTSYDIYGNATRIDAPDSSYVTMTYGPPAISALYNEPSAFITSIDRDIHGQRKTATFQSDFTGAFITKVDESGSIFTAVRDGVGRLLRVSDPEYVTFLDYGTSTIPWNVSPELLSVPTSAWQPVSSGIETFFSYQLRGTSVAPFTFLRKLEAPHGRLARLLSFHPTDSAAAGAASQFLNFVGYNTNGTLTTSQLGLNALRKEWQDKYDMFDRPLRRYTPSRSTAATSAGELIEQSEQWTYDDKFLPRTEISSKYAYLAIRSTIDGQTRLYTDALGRIIARAQDVRLASTDAALTTIMWKFAWNKRGLLSGIVAPNGDFVALEYDSHGKLAKRTRGKQGDVTCLRNETALNGCITETWHSNYAGLVDLYMDGAGLSTALSYDGSGNPNIAVDPANRVHTYDTDHRGRITSHCFTGACEAYTYGARGDLTNRTDSDGFTFSYGHDFFHKTTSATDISRATTTAAYYDVFGNEVASYDELGHVWTRIYDGYGRLASASEPRGAIANHSYVTNAFGDVIEDNTPSAPEFSRSYERDSLGRIIKSKSSLTVATAYTYNGLGRAAQVTELPRQNTWSYDYDALGRQVRVRSPENRQVFTEYDFADRVTSEQKGDDTWSYAYDARGRIASVTNPNGGQTTLHYNILGLVSRITRGDLGDVTLQYVDENGNPDTSGRRVLVTDGAGDWTRLESSARGDLLKRTTIVGDVETSTYDSLHNVLTYTRFNSAAPSVTSSESRSYYANGLLHGITFENGTQRLHEYDFSGNLTSETDEMGLVTTWAYAKPISQPTAYDAPSAPPTSFTYDGLGRLRTAVVQADASHTRTSVIAYDDVAGRITKTPSGRGAWVDVLSPDGNIASRKSPTETNARAFTYDAAYRLQAVTDEVGNVTTYSYDGMGSRTHTQINGATNGDVNTYDVYGRLDTVTNTQGVTDHIYRPSDGRLEEIVHPDGSSSFFGYTGDKQMSLRSERGPTGTLLATKVYAYNYQGLLKSIVETSGGVVKQLELKRDTRGRVRAEIASGSVSSINDADYYANGLLKRTNTTHYDRNSATGLLSAIRVAARSGDYATYGVPVLAPDSSYSTLTFTRTPFLEPETLTSPSGVNIAWSWSNAGDLESITTPHNQRTIGHWPDGNLQSVSLTDGGLATTESYSYVAGRLARATGTSLGDQSFEYDGAGNLKKIVDVATSSTLESRIFDASNRLQSVTANGHTDIVTYDGRGRLSTVGTGSTAKTYIHDAFDRLVQTKTGSLVSQNFAYDAADRIVSDQNIDSGRSRTLEHFGVTASRMTVSGQTTNVVSNPDTGDAFGVYGAGGQFVSLRVGQRLVEELDGTGAQVATQLLGPYGRAISGTADNVPFGFQGYYRHIDSDLNRSFARSYAPSVMAFTSADPISGTMAWPESMNRWRTFSGNPLNVRDFMGLVDNPPTHQDEQTTENPFFIFGGSAGSATAGGPWGLIGGVGVAVAWAATHWEEFKGWFQPGGWFHGFFMDDYGAAEAFVYQQYTVAASKTRNYASPNPASVGHINPSEGHFRPYSAAGARGLPEPDALEALRNTIANNPSAQEWGRTREAGFLYGEIAANLPFAAVLGPPPNATADFVQGYQLGLAVEGARQTVQGIAQLGASDLINDLTRGPAGALSRTLTISITASGVRDLSQGLVNLAVAATVPAPMQMSEPPEPTSAPAETSGGKAASAETNKQAVNQAVDPKPGQPGINATSGNGGSLANLSSQEAARIQNAANRIGKPITLTGSRAGGTASPLSDWDYVIDVNKATRNKIKNSLPGSGDATQGLPPNLEFFHNLREGAPYIIFNPVVP